MNSNPKRHRQACLLCMLLLLCATLTPHIASTKASANNAPATAQAPMLLYVHGTTMGKYERIRVALREQPSTSSDLICRIYNGIAVEYIADAPNGFVKVRLGAVEGYMMKKFLSADPTTHYPKNGYVHGYNHQRKVEMYSTPDMLEAVAELPDSSIDWDGVSVLAVAHDWLYILHNGIYGYIPYWYIEETGNFRTATAWPENANQYMAFYNKPNGKIIGYYHKGCFLYFLFDPELLNEWVRVRIGNTPGYVKSDYTDGWIVDMPELPEMMVHANTANIHAEPSDQSPVDLQLPMDTIVRIMGFIGDWYHVEYGDYDTAIYHGFMRSQDLISID